MEEVILNLINNARDAFTGKMQMDLPKDSPHILVTTSEQKDDTKHNVIIKVIDFGTGIPKELMQKIFDPFFTTKDPDKGTGLGLSISKSVIEGFHGSIDIQSVPGSGTAVTIALPVNSQKEEKRNG